MKAKELNNSSFKTRTLIKKVFAELMGEKQEICKISIKELTDRAGINRSTFYLHYDNVWSVAEDYEEELLNAFFNDSKLMKFDNKDSFIDAVFEYLLKNHDNYTKLCKSNDIFFSFQRKIPVISKELLESAMGDQLIKKKDYLDIEITMFIEGLLVEYIKFCRGLSEYSPKYLLDYTKKWTDDFFNRRR